MTARIAHCEVMSAHDMAGYRDVLSRKDIQWSGIVVVCPPRAVDEALTDTAQLDLALSRTLLVANLVKTLTEIGSRNSHGCGSSPAVHSSSISVIESPWRRPNFVG